MGGGGGGQKYILLEGSLHKCYVTYQPQLKMLLLLCLGRNYFKFDLKQYQSPKEAEATYRFFISAPVQDI